MTRFWDGRTDRQTDGETDGVTALLDLLSPSATQVKTGSDSSTAKRSALDVSVKGPWR